MLPEKPSHTAHAAAAHRAAHQILERGVIFADPLALPILPEPINAMLQKAAAPHRRPMRLFIAARTRFAEDALARALAMGTDTGTATTQIVVLGAGLDTYAYRTPARAGLRIFEVDHPATQLWKRQRLEEIKVTPPPGLIFAPVDFERETLEHGLQAAGFDFTQRTFFTWLGVVPYLSEASVWTTLRFIGRLSGGASVVFDYSDPPSTLSPEAQRAHQMRAEYVAKIGEAWRCYFDGALLREGLLAAGFSEIEDLGPRQLGERYFSPWRTPDAAPLHARGGHVVLAQSNGGASVLPAAFKPA